MEPSPTKSTTIMRVLVVADREIQSKRIKTALRGSSFATDPITPDALPGRTGRWAAAIVVPETLSQRLTALASLRRTHPDLPIVAVASDARPLLDAMRAGAAGAVFWKDINDIGHVLADVVSAKQEKAPSAPAQVTTPHLEALGRLAGGVAHDFNNILAIIETCTGWLAEQVGPQSPLYEDIETIQLAGRRGADLTRALLVFSRQEHRGEVEYVIANETVEETFNMACRVVESSVRTELSLAPDVMTVKIDSGHLSQVLMNLVVNARHAMPNGGLLTVSTEVQRFEDPVSLHTGNLPAGEYMVLTVRDTGTGINPEVVKHLFEPFFTTREDDGGTGLGLFTAYGVVSGAGGAMRVSSDTTGTEFQVFLPHFRRSPGPITRQPKALPGGTETILLVEDEQDVRGVARRFLQQHGYAVIEAAHGADAMLLLEKHANVVDLVLSDVLMPVMDGASLSRAVHERWPTMPFVFLSAYSAAAITTGNEELPPGAVVVGKPWRRSTLLRTLREVLDHAQGAASPTSGVGEAELESVVDLAAPGLR